MDQETVKTKFSELTLSEEMQRAIAEVGYEEASPIQAAGIPVLLAGRDVIGQAQTGTGKTAAFAIPAIELVDTDSREVQVPRALPHPRAGRAGFGRNPEAR